ncbi:coenzyme F390 synthetase [Saprospira grandis DSM 2844]|uniref:Coenzyme F390 synthetase n=1 Tax=Saprospira grandis DSM 2844 TaxID=694433 RepID=J1I2U3_9BACT|nr:GH3 auxin-responsive promoter family protein [Saprospira grandis]EJF53035.1 coenzyme F390 synthetase [Saprospira grandis DSM 2844]
MSKIKGQLFKRGLMWHLRSASQRQQTPLRLQQQSLQFLLQMSEQTAFGHHYKFAQIRAALDPIRAYQEQLPIVDYEQMYAHWWHRLLEDEANVVWPGKIRYFAQSSGTSGSPSKQIPVSKAMLGAMKRSTKFMFAHSTQWELGPDFYGRDFLIMGSSTTLRKQGQHWLGDISGINATQMPSWFRGFYKPGTKIIKLPNWEERLAAIAEQAHKWDLSVIAGIPSWVQMMLERVLQVQKADQIIDIWPNLKIYVSGGIAFSPYRQRFKELIGGNVHTLDTYNTSEGSLACQTRIDDEVMPLELILNNGIFFEFIPFNADNFSPTGQLLPQAKALHIGEVREGKEYALLLSTCSGAWRYLLGDTVRILNKQRAEVRLTGRIKHFVSICGEHLSVDNMNEALARCESELGLQFGEFHLQAVKVGNHFEHHWFLGQSAPLAGLSEELLAQQLDQYLGALNDDYKTEREDNLLRKVKLRLLPNALFWEWWGQQKRIDGQSKFPRVLTAKQFADWKQFLDAKGY